MVTADARAAVGAEALEEGPGEPDAALGAERRRKAARVENRQHVGQERAWAVGRAGAEGQQARDNGNEWTRLEPTWHDIPPGKLHGYQNVGDGSARSIFSSCSWSGIGFGTKRGAGGDGMSGPSDRCGFGPRLHAVHDGENFEEERGDDRQCDAGFDSRAPALPAPVLPDRNCFHETSVVGSERRGPRRRGLRTAREACHAALTH